MQDKFPLAKKVTESIPTAVDKVSETLTKGAQETSKMTLAEQAKRDLIKRPLDIAKFIFNANKFIVQAPLQATTKVGLSAIEQVTGKPQSVKFESEIPKALFGTDKLNTIQESIKGVEQKVGEFGGSPLEKQLYPTPLVVGSIVLDILPGGEKRKAALNEAESLFNTVLKSERETIENVIRKEYKGLTDDTYKSVSNDLYMSAKSGKQSDVYEKLKVLKSEIETPQVKETQFDPYAYVKEQVEKQKIARGPEESILTKIKSVVPEAKKKLVDFTSPITDVVYKYKSEITPSTDINNNIDRVLRAPTLAGQFMKDNGLDNLIKTVDDTDAFNQYLIARHNIDLNTRGIETGRDYVKDTELVKAFNEQYEPIAKEVSAYSQKLLDYVSESGIISKETAQKLKEMYPNYVPFNRIFSETELEGFKLPSNKSLANLSNQTVVQKIEGSVRQVENPLESFIKKTVEAFDQAERNKAASTLVSYKDLPGNPLDIKPLRLSEEVKQRMELYAERKAFKPVESKLETIVKRESKQVRRLQSEINRLNKEGLKVATGKTSTTSELPGIKSAIKTKIKNNEFLLEDVYAQLKNKDTKRFVESLIKDDGVDLRKIRRLISSRDTKLVSLIDNLEKVRNEYLGVKDIRANLLDEARALADLKPSKDKDIISLYKDGIKEYYEVPKYVSQAAKSLKVGQVGLLGKILRAPVRIARVGITGIIPAFVLANVIRDQMFTAITGIKGFKESIANPDVFMRAFLGAIKHNKDYDEMVRMAAGGTSFDISRSAPELTIEALRSQRDVKSRVKYLATNPSELLRSVEDIVARGEEFTRLQQYLGTKEYYLKQGMNAEDAAIMAANAAREASVNFARRGEWGSVLSSALLYLNAGIQGSRRLVREFQDNPTGTAAKVASAILLPTAISTAYNLSDEKTRAIYEDISEYEKENNLIIIPPGAQKDADGKWEVIKIPLPPGIGSMASIPRKVIESYVLERPIDGKSMINDIVKSFSPVGTDFNSIMSTLLPQAIKPAVQSVANYNFFTEQPLVSPSLSRLSPELQYKDTTSGTAKKIGQTLGFSPIKVEEFMKDTFGRLGSYALNASDKVLAGINVIPEEEIGGMSLFEDITRRFSKASGGELDRKTQNQLSEILQKQNNDKFILKQEAELVYEDIMKIQDKEQRKAKALEIKKANPKLYEQVKEVRDQERKNLSYSDRLMLQLSVTDGVRAKYIAEVMKSMSKEEKNKYASGLKKKGIMSDNVKKQVKSILNKQSK